MTRNQARELYDYYSAYITQLTAAQTALTSGGAQSYTIGDRSVTRFDITKISGEIEAAVKKRDEYFAIMTGRPVRGLSGIIPTDF